MHNSGLGYVETSGLGTWTLGVRAAFKHGRVGASRNYLEVQDVSKQQRNQGGKFSKLRLA